VNAEIAGSTLTRRFFLFTLAEIKIALRMQKKSRIFLVAALAIAAALLGLIFIRSFIDFPVYYSAGRSLLGGRSDLYAPDFAQGQVMDYRYVPFFLILFLPLWLLPYSLASYTWYLLSVLQIAGCIWAAHKGADDFQSTTKIWIISALATAQYFVMILHYGNAHLLAIFLLLASFHLASGKRDLSAATVMSLSVTIKLTPILLLPYFAMKWKWKLLLLVFILTIAFNIMPSVYFGFQKNAGLMKTWYEHVIVNQEFHETNGPINLSLKGQLRRYFTSVDYSQRIDGDVRYTSINVFSFSPEAIDRVWMLFSSAIYLFGLVIIIRRPGQKAGADMAYDDSTNEAHDNYTTSKDLAPLELGLMICIMLLVGPLTSKIYFIALLWPVVTLAVFAFNNSSPSATFARRVLILVALMNSVLPLLPGRSVQRLLLVLGVDFYVNCLIAVAVAYALISTRPLFRPLPDGRQKRVLSAAKKP
jgi:Glycosyltransferase family 87